MPPAASAPRLRFQGQPQLCLGDNPPDALSIKDALLLAMVAIDGPIARERVGEWLWPRSSPERQRNSLRQRLHRLRERAGFVLVAYEPILRWQPDIAHDLDTYADLSAWPERWMQGCEAVDAEPARRWLEHQRESRTALRHATLAQRLDTLEKAQAWPEAMAFAAQWMASERGSELPTLRLMQLQARSGDHPAALARYRQLQAAAHHSLPPGELSADLHALLDSSTSSERAPVPLTDQIDIRRWLGNPPLLIGREAELLAMTEASSRKRVIVLVGEAGIGKSRLAQAWAGTHGPYTLVSARSGDAYMPYALAARIVRALSDQQGQNSPYWPGWVRAELARIAPQLGDIAAGPLLPARLLAAFEVAASPVSAICVEDLHFADDASVELLAAAVASAPQRRWLMSTRPDARSRVLRSWLEGLAEQALLLTPGPWQEASLAQLLAAIARMAPELSDAVSASAMQRHTGGVPLFVLRTLDQMFATRNRNVVPAALPRVSGVQALIARRVRGLPQDAMALLRAAALAGADFNLPLAADVLGRHPTELTNAWALLTDALLMHDQGVAHDLVAEAARETIPKPVARWMHAAIARHLQSRREAGPTRIAAHFEAAGQWAEAALAYRQAAQQAFARSRRAEEAQLLQRAAACHAEAGDPTRAMADLAQRVGALVQCDGSAHAMEALELVQRAKTPAERVLALLARAESQNVTGDFAGVCAALPEVIELARSSGDAFSEAVAARRMAYAMTNIGRHADAVSLLDHVAPRLMSSLSPVDQAQFLADQATVLAGSNRRVAAARLQAELVDRLLALGQQTDALTCMTNLGVNLYAQGRLPEALASVQRALVHPAFAEQSDGIGMGIRLTAGQLLRDLGRFNEALATTSAVASAARAAGLALWQAHAENQLGVLWLMLGRPAQAWQQVAVHPEAELPPFIVAGRWLTQAQVQRAMGHPQPEWLERGLDVLKQGERPDVRLRLWAERCLSLAPCEAHTLARDMLEEADGLEMPGLAVLAQTRLLQALLRLATGRRLARKEQLACEEAERDLLNRVGQAQPPSVYLPTVWAVIVDAQLQRGDAAAARTVLGTAIDWLAGVAPHVPTVARASWQTRGEQHLWLRQQALQLGLAWPLRDVD